MVAVANPPTINGDHLRVPMIVMAKTIRIKMVRGHSKLCNISSFWSLGYGGGGYGGGYGGRKTYTNSYSSYNSYN